MMPDITPNLTDSQKLNMNVITINTAVNELQTDVKKLNTVVLEGNGELPIREQVRNHERFIGEIRYWIKFIFGIVVTWTIGQMILAVVAINWLYPILTKLANQP